MDELEAWAASGAMALTGRADGPPRVGPGAPASWLAGRLEELADLAPGARLPGVGLLGQRAAHTGFGRNGPWSCGGSFRTLPTRDGVLGLSLARAADRELVPALVGAAAPDPWAAVTVWAADSSTADAAVRVRELGLPGGPVGPVAGPHRPGVLVTASGPRRSAHASPLVVDLSALWAGPLCTSLLTRTGARVVSVETPTRPDGMRAGSPTFHRLLRRGAREQVLRLDSTQLRDLLARADVVVESARPRALRQVGVHAEDLVAAGTTWVSVTASGRASDDVGFGDDVAVRAGHVVADAGDVLPVGDALADPLTGVAAAVGALRAWRDGEAQLLDVSMLHVAAEALAAGRPAPHQVRRDGLGRWWVETDHAVFPVADPVP